MQNFTGASKKTRQVNLSGRNVSNPWAAKSGSTTTSGPQNTVAQAQAERLKRQQERDRLHAAKTIQRSWRGHKSREEKRREWRAEWDRFEDSRTGSSHPSFDAVNIVSDGHDNTYERTLFSIRSANIPSYTQERDLVSQLRLLVGFFDGRHATDHLRLLYFGDVLQATLGPSMHLPFDNLLRLLLRKFGRLLTQATRASPGQIDLLTFRKASLDDYLRIVIFLERIIPTDMCSNASNIFEALSRAVQSGLFQPGSSQSKIMQELAAEVAVKLLDTTSSHTSNVYLSFAARFLAVTRLDETPEILTYLATHVNQQILANTIISSLESTDRGQVQVLRQSGHALSILGYLIFMRKIQISGRTEPAKASEPDDLLPAIAILLGYCADEIAAITDPNAEPSIQLQSDGTPPVPEFFRTQIDTLRESRSIEEVLAYITKCQLSAPNTARLLAKYALNLLRAFPTRAYDIRMRIFLNPATAEATGNLNTIKYFWDASQGTEIFRIAVKGPGNVMTLLKPGNAQNEQINRPSLSAKQNSKEWRDDWRLILFFFELYTLALKVMDDEEFFSLDDSKIVLGTSQQEYMHSRGPLPLAQISTMVTFLKNLAFTLYWNAAELSPTDPMEYEGQISNYLRSYGTEPHPRPRKAPDLVGLEGVSLNYLKGLTTGVLRMLHERDSRRSFLPENHWLMTSNVDMMSFIPAVVAEEEKRNQLGDEDEDEEGGDDDDDPFSNDVDVVDMGVSMNPYSGARLRRRDYLSTRRQNQEIRRQEQARKQRQIASLAPRLEILRNLPFFIPFQTRVTIFRYFVENDQMRRRGGRSADEWRMVLEHGFDAGMAEARRRLARHSAQVHRERIFEDAFDQFYELGEALKEPMQITFINEHGENEAGIDGGGVTKEFLTSVTSEALKPKDNCSLFTENEQRIIYPNASFFDQTIEQYRMLGMPSKSAESNQAIKNALQKYEFLGRIVGKCMYESILIDVHFASFFLLKWALTGGTTSASNERGYRANINDLRDMDPDLYRGLLQLKNYRGDVEKDFGLDFTVVDHMDIPTSAGRQLTHSTTRELIPNGRKTPVTNANRLYYIDRIVRYRLQIQPELVTNAFLKGLGQMIQPMWLAMFNQKELQSLVGGDDSELDLADLRRNTEVSGVYQRGDDGLDHPTVELFWKVLKDMTDQDRRKVLKFVTSTPRAPLQGFSHLYPRFSIRDSSDDQSRLPSASTCANLLKLPRYSTEKVMREKLLYAANSGAGFDLS